MPDSTASNLNKTVLMVVYYFPPYAGVASQRSEKLHKYLPAQGWTPIAFTVDERYYGTRVLPRNGSLLWAQDKEGQIVKLSYYRVPMTVFLTKVRFPVLALSYATRHRDRISAVYISGSPFHSFLITPILTSILHLPSVIDFRDSWSINHGYDGKPADTLWAKARAQTIKILEAIAIRFATRAVFATTRLREEYVELYPQWSYKFFTLHNGFDPEDVASVTPRRQYPRTTLILAGKFHMYTPEAVDALMLALRDTPDLSFVYVGEEHAIIKNAAHRHGVNAQVTTLSFQPQKKVLELTAGADIGLVTTGMVNGLGTKIFEYLALGKPAVCLVPEGSVISSEFHSTPSVLVSHPPHTASRIAELLKRARTMVGHAQSTDLAPFNRRNNAAMLAKWLDEISG